MFFSLKNLKEKREMKMIFAILLGLFVLLASPVYAKCSDEIENPTGIIKQLEYVVQKVMNSTFVVPCSSLASVLTSLKMDKIEGGRGLEADKSLNCQKARDDLQEALNIAEIRTEIEKVRTTIADENERLIYEAAIFDDSGYQNARDLKILQLKGKHDSSTMSCS
jgi:hypothetical protein